MLDRSAAGYYPAPMRLRHALVVVIAATYLTACTTDKPQPNLVGQDIRLTIIHTSDIHSRLFPYHFTPNKFDQEFGLHPGAGPYGGIARIATMVKRIRKSADRSLWLDSGDAWEGAPVFNEFKGEVELRALSLAGMDGAVLRPVCDIGVVVCHLGLDTDEGLSSSQVDEPNQALAGKGVDLVRGGHL